MDQSVFMIFLINKMTQQSRGHTKLYILKKVTIFPKGSQLHLELFKKKKNPVGLSIILFSKILKDVSVISDKGMLDLVQGESCFFFCDLDIYLMPFSLFKWMLTFTSVLQ